MRTALLIWTHIMVFLAGIHFAEWSSREGHATMIQVGQWLRSWFV